MGRRPTGESTEKTAAYGIFDNESLVTFLGSELAECATLGVGDGYDAYCGLGFADFGFKTGFEQTESDCGLGGCARFGYYDNAEAFAFEISHEFVEVVLADVLACEKHHGAFCVCAVGRESVAEGFDYGFGTEVRTADTDRNNYVAVLAERTRSGFNVGGKSLVGT